MISRKLITSTFIYTLGGSLPLLSGLILIPLFINQLSVEVYSAYVLLQVMILLFQTIGVLNLNVSTQSYYYDFINDKPKLNHFMGTLLSNMILFGTLLILFFSLFGDLLFQFLFKNNSIDFYPYGFVALLTGTFYAFFKAYSNFLILREKPGLFLILNLSVFFLTIGCTLLFIRYEPGTLFGPMIGRLFPAVLAVLIVLYLYYKDYGISWDKELTKKILVYSFPSLINLLIIWLVGNVDRLMINSMMTPKDVGVFDLAIKCAMVLEFVLAGLANAIYPKIFDIWTSQKEAASSIKENRYQHVFMLVTILLIAGLNIFFPIAITIFLKKDVYLEALYYIPLIALGYLSRGLYNIYLYPIYYYKQTKLLPKIFLIIAAIQLISSYLLIYWMGLMGAVYALLINKLVQIWLLKQNSQKFFKFKFNPVKMIYLPVGYALVLLTGEYLFKDINRILLYCAEFILTLIIVFIAYRTEIKGIILNRKLV